MYGNTQECWERGTISHLKVAIITLGEMVVLLSAFCENMMELLIDIGRKRLATKVQMCILIY